MKNLDAFFDNVDVYDAYVDRKVKINSRASYQIDVGLDHKDTLMKKAEKLGLYKDFIVADANCGLPFENESFHTVFSNIIYWLDDPKFIFSEIYRILRVGGRCCVMLPGPQYLESSFYYKYYVKPERTELKFLDLIDRGRFKENLKQVKSREEWDGMIEEAGFKIDKCIPHLSTTLIQIWDIGLRPIFPMLKKMVDEIEERRRYEIKEEWINLFEQIGFPIIQNDSLLTQGKEYCFYCYILSK